MEIGDELRYEVCPQCYIGYVLPVKAFDFNGFSCNYCDELYEANRIGRPILEEDEPEEELVDVNRNLYGDFMDEEDEYEFLEDEDMEEAEEDFTFGNQYSFELDDEDEDDEDEEEDEEEYEYRPIPDTYDDHYESDDYDEFYETDDEDDLMMDYFIYRTVMDMFK